MNPQIKGLDTLAGTYVFDVATSNRVLKLNRFFWGMISFNRRTEFLADPEAEMRSAGLTEHECDLVRRQDWIGLIRHGANFFVVEKFARVVKRTNLEVYALMRGESFDDFMKTRRVPDSR